MAVGLLSLANCGGAAVEDRLADYHWRVGNVLEIDAAKTEYRPVPAYPRRRVRVVPLPDLRLSPGEALRFRDCLGREIGERNSILGQVMQPSTRFSYETRVTSALRDCSAETQADQELLTSIQVAKERSLQAAGQNLLFSSAEMESFLGVASGPMSLDALNHGLTGTQALVDLTASVSRGVQGAVLSETELAALLQQLRESRQATALMQTARQFEGHLRAVSLTIHRRLDQRALCLQPRPTPAAQVAETVFHKFYAGRIQPELSAVQRALARLDQALNEALLAPGFMPPGALESYVESVSVLHRDLVEASRHHAEAWQRLLGQCGRMPDRSDSHSAN